MQIVVDVRQSIEGSLDGVKDFTIELFGRIANAHKDHNFVFVVDREVVDQRKLPGNVITITIAPTPKNFLSYRLWYDVKLPILLKKYKADLFVGTNGICSLTTATPQLLVVREVAFKQRQKFQPGYDYRKNYTGKFIKKAGGIAAVSQFVGSEVLENFDKTTLINVVGAGVDDDFKPVNWEQKEEIKSGLTDGCEYFVFTGGLLPATNFINVLKAFSIFKKWQRSNMKLVVTGPFDARFSQELEKLKTYKYRSDVVLKNDLTVAEKASIVAGAYACVAPAFYVGFAQSVLEALKCEVPVITSPASSMSEVAGGAALYANPAEPEEIAAQMKLVYKDEQLRTKLIEESRLRIRAYSWEETMDSMWKLIEEVVSK